MQRRGPNSDSSNADVATIDLNRVTLDFIVVTESKIGSEMLTKASTMAQDLTQS